jgi:hypothetical protein
LDAANQTSILKEIAHFGLKIMQGILVIQAEHELNNEVALDLAPLVMLFQLVEMAHTILLIWFTIHIEVNWQNFGPMRKSISLNDINKNSSVLTRGNPTPNSSLISRIMKRSSIRDGMIQRDTLSICEYSTMVWQMLSPIQQVLSRILAF